MTKLSQDQMFEALYSQFPAGDELLWLWESKSYLRVRRYDDGAWLAGRRVEAVVYWGA